MSGPMPGDVAGRDRWKGRLVRLHDGGPRSRGRSRRARLALLRCTAGVLLCPVAPHAVQRGWLPGDAGGHQRDRPDHGPVARGVDRRPGRRRGGVGPDPLVRRGTAAPRGRRGPAAAGPVQHPDRDPLHRRPVRHDRRAVRLHRSRRVRHHAAHAGARPEINVVGKQWSWDFNYLNDVRRDETSTRSACRRRWTASPARGRPTLVAAGRRAGASSC